MPGDSMIQDPVTFFSSWIFQSETTRFPVFFTWLKKGELSGIMPLPAIRGIYTGELL
jgi:hypothetical protein